MYHSHKQSPSDVLMLLQGLGRHQVNYIFIHFSFFFRSDHKDDSTEVHPQQFFFNLLIKSSALPYKPKKTTRGRAAAGTSSTPAKTTTKSQSVGHF